ncbi:MAG: hypothetical protein R2730_11885 [Chitinophagales bacterium]
MKKAISIFLLCSSIFVLAQAQTESVLVDSFTIKPMVTDIPILDDGLTVGNRYGLITLCGEGLTDVRKRSKEEHSEFETLEFNPDRNCFETSYIQFRDIEFTYKGQAYSIKIELIQIDFPENEIAWRMVPKYYIYKTA